MKRTKAHEVSTHTHTKGTRGGTRMTPEPGQGDSGMTGGLMSTLNEMERFVEESLHRPFFTWHMTPLRHMLHESDFGDFIPAVDVLEGADEIVIKAELPGMKRDEIDTSLEDGMLVISGEKRREEKEEHRDYLRLERTHGRFRRTLSIPDGIDDTHVAATYKDGILEVRLPKLQKRETGLHITIE